MKRRLAVLLIFLLLFPTTTLQLVAQTSHSDKTTPLLTPTAYFPFDGDLADAKQPSQSGVAWTRFEEGVSTWGEKENYTFDFVSSGLNQAVVFDGETGIKLPEELLTSDSYSYSFWLKQTGDISTFTSALFFGTTDYRTSFSPAVAGTGELIYAVGENVDGLANNYQYTPLPAHDPFEWQHVFITATNDTVRLYLNGVAVGAIAEAPDLFTGRFNDFLLGFNPFPDAYYHGLMDELMFFDGQVVGEDTIQAYYQLTASAFGHDLTSDGSDEGIDDEVGDSSENEQAPPSEEVITNLDIPSLPEKQEIPSFTNVGVHDPSIIASNGYFYAFGTHGEAAKSRDLMNWETFTNGYTTPGNILYKDLSVNLAEAFLWAGEDDSDSKGGYAVWAPEAFFNKDYQWEDGTTGAYMIYYSASSTYIRSVIGYAVAKEIEGPYEHVDTVIYSGFTNHEAYDADSTINKHVENTNIPALIDAGVIEGVRSGWFNASGGYNNTVFTNAIDANLFYDIDGTLWMTYGSWSGGIFIIEVDKTTGQVIYPGVDGTTADGRMIDRYFGTKISGGYTKSGEGPYVEYNPQDGYYYLYVTYGWLGADGAYHMRQFRSEQPDGPYVDRAGEPAVLPGNVSNAGYGNKLTGNFLFNRLAGEPGSGNGYGYVSPGHNSIYTDQATNQQFNVFHTRFPERGEQHELRVHQLFNNEEGWRVMAPLRYAGETLDADIDYLDVLGTYKYIDHGKNNDVAIKTSSLIHLESDGKISGAITGTWEKDGAYLTLSTTDYVAKGVVLTQWDEVSARWLTTFSVLAEDGSVQWGVKHPLSGETDEAIVEKILTSLQLPEQTIADLTLPTMGAIGATIEWSSSDTDVITALGAVTRPHVGEANATVTLIATVTLGETQMNKSFDVTVNSIKEARLQAHYSFDGHLDDETNQQLSGVVTSANPLDTEGNGDIIFDQGKFNQAAYFDGQSGIELPQDLIVENHYSISFWFNPETLTSFTPSLFVMRDADHWFTVNPKGWNDEILLWSRVATPNERWFDGITGKKATVNQWHHVVLTNTYGRGNIYLNGERVSSFNDFNPVVNGDDLTILLGVNPFDTAFKGYIDEVVIYQAHAVSVEDVQALYRGEVPEVRHEETEVKPTAHFSFNQGLEDNQGRFNEAQSTTSRLDTFGGDPTFVEAGLDHALYLNGEQGVNLGRGLITERSYSVSFWLNPEELRDFTTVFFAADTPERWLSFLPGGSHGQGLTKLWSGTSWYDAELDYTLPTNEWSHVAFTVDFGQLKIYINGEKMFEGEAFPNVFQTNDATFGLGVNYWDTPYKGYIDEVIIYDGHVLSDEQILADYEEEKRHILEGESEPGEEDEEKDEDDDSEGESNPGEEDEEKDEDDDSEGETEPGEEDEEEDEDEDGNEGSFVVDSVAFFDYVKTESGEVLYRLKTDVDSLSFKGTWLDELSKKAFLEIIRDEVTLKIPVSVLQGLSEITLTMTDITELTSALLEGTEDVLLSDVLSYTLTHNGEKIDFSDEGIVLTFHVDSSDVRDWTKVHVLYVDDSNALVENLSADILMVNDITGQVMVIVRHFSGYGLAETRDDAPPLEDEGSGDQQGEVDEEDTDHSVGGSDEDKTNDIIVSGDNDETLPHTATSMYLFLYLGFWTMLLAGGWLYYKRLTLNA
ncbi:hypothetical protein GCM10012290_15300 [Halolactibacillus alkaliphilus]|uniref:Uncharacterized protein n=1 Tax=Halolactibacillus alkaliphilus TaxID=442899 RepID=A0A511X1E3_9BACI|nr:LamG-like jellyroll fold domain-containing protein [Halolactibacillus alkaliphilus]GEN56730.1 hypothetical protein HAL01_11940 [Halolactibacillus alkaliphilus]GGN70952.1 hypothetical protein GCM10012290_15300 [Halolactibacillus alkaliphilus]SFO80149.1 LPXTG-motif cell wall anchor domain-containing protein [Halolactibacillus alkaliphilus]